MGSISQPKWKKVEYSRNAIIKAGKTIKKDTLSPEEKKEALKIIDNWRASHAYPLHIIYMHLRRMVALRNDIVVAERLKRLDSIVNKLKREPTMSLWAMQDLGGCRFVVQTVDDVYEYAEKYESSRKRHILKNTYDYIESPKKSGYRSLHKVYEYYSDTNDVYNKNMLIEIQFRTHLQHIWATAVETMGIFTKESLKAGQGSDDMKRFFVLTSSLFAIRENQPVVPGTSSDVNEIVAELKKLDENNNFLNLLNGIKSISEGEYEAEKDYKTKTQPGYYILILNYATCKLTVKAYKSSEFEKANAIYNSIEKNNSESKVDAVLVRVSSLNTLRAAYPNYFSDISEFVDIMTSYLK